MQSTLNKVLSVKLEDTPVLLTEPAQHNKEYRMKLCEHMFETLNVPAIFIVKDPVLCSFAVGRSSALVLDVGDTETLATPVNEGYALLKSINRFEIGGKKLTIDLLNFILDEKRMEVRPRFTFKKKFIMLEGQETLQVTDLSKEPEVVATQPDYFRWCQMQIAKDMKEEFLLVSDDMLDSTAGKAVDQSRIGTHELPDGSKLELTGYERMAHGEQLF